MSEKVSLISVLSKMQKELKVPKEQFNGFSKYKFRSCEDILEAVKKVLPDDVTLVVEDQLVQLSDRYYVKATASLHLEGYTPISASAYAREALSKKGFDESQITGAASSYARKYALSGLFLIDDAKDADTRDNRQDEENRPNMHLMSQFNTLVLKHNISIETQNAWLKWAGAKHINDMSESQISALISKMQEKELSNENH